MNTQIIWKYKYKFGLGKDFQTGRGMDQLKSCKDMINLRNKPGEKR